MSDKKAEFVFLYQKRLANDRITIAKTTNLYEYEKMEVVYKEEMLLFIRKKALFAQDKNDNIS